MSLSSQMEWRATKRVEKVRKKKKEMGIANTCCKMQELWLSLPRIHSLLLLLNLKLTPHLDS